MHQTLRVIFSWITVSTFILFFYTACDVPQRQAKTIDLTTLESKDGLSFSGNYPNISNQQRLLAIRNDSSGISYLKQHAFHKAFDALVKVAPYYNADSLLRKKLPLFYQDLATACVGKGDYETAIKSYTRALSHDSALLHNDRHYLEGHILLQLCQIYNTLKQYHQATNYLTQGEHVSNTYKNPSLKAECQLIKGGVNMGRKDYSLALKHYKKAFKTATLNNLPQLKLLAINNLALAYCAMDSIKQALTTVQVIDSNIRNIKAVQPVDSGSLYMLLATSGQVYYAAHDYHLAESFFKTALQYYQSHNLPQSIVDIYDQLYKTYKAEHNDKLALQTLEQCNQLKEKLINSQVIRNANELEVKYRVSEKDRKIASHQLELSNQQNKAKLDKQRFIITTGILVFIVLGLLMYYFLQRNKLRLLKKEQQINLYKAMMQGEEQERLRISENLHDSVGALLATIKLNIESNFATASNQHQMIAISELVDESAEEVRRIAHNLMPDILVKNTLEQAFMLYCSNIQQRTGIIVELQYAATLENCSAQSKLFLFRIMQEMLQNIVKHARATHVYLQVREMDNRLNITVEDNGKGFDTNEDLKGSGLKNMQLRVATLSGNMEISTRPGHGTTIFLNFCIAALEK